MAANCKLAESRILAVKKLSYLRHEIMALIPVESPGLGTCAMDEYGRLYYDSAFLEARDLGHCAFVVLHEDVHFHQHHAKRRVACIGQNPPEEDLAIWRLVVDSSTNEILEQSGLKCPEEGITPAKLGLPKNLTPEQGFHILRKRRDEEREKARQAAQEQAEQNDAQKQEDNAQDSDGGENEPQDDQDTADEQDTSDDPTEAQDEGEGQESDEQGEGDDSQDRATGEAGDDSESGDGEGDSDGESDQAGDSVESDGDGEGQGGQADGNEGDGQPTSQSASEIGGSATDGIPRPWELGPPTEENPGLQEHEINLIEAATAKAIEQHMATYGKGSVANALAKQAGDLLHKPVDPCKELAARVKYAVDQTSGFGSYTFRRPNRRQPEGAVMLPAHVKPIPKIVVCVDSSASMGSEDTALALATISNALRSMPDPRGLRVLVGDTEVRTAQNVFRKESVVVAGNGGTSMEVLLAAAYAEKPRPKAVILVTDGECRYGDEPDGIHVLVCLTRTSRWMAPPPAWCETVLLNP